MFVGDRILAILIMVPEGESLYLMMVNCKDDTFI